MGRLGFNTHLSWTTQHKEERMILKCDVCGNTLTETEADIESICPGDFCPLCEILGNDGRFECCYEEPWTYQTKNYVIAF